LLRKALIRAAKTSYTAGTFPRFFSYPDPKISPKKAHVKHFFLKFFTFFSKNISIYVKYPQIWLKFSSFSPDNFSIMNTTSNLLTASELATILNVNVATVQALAASGVLRKAGAQGNRPLFAQETIASWLANRLSSNSMADKEYLEKLRAQYLEEFPEAMADLQKLDAKFPRPKLYSLHKVFGRRHGGYVWYVRYIENGKLVHSRWCTHTSDRAFAERWARDNRERLLEEYHKKKENYSNFFGVFERYYAPGSAYLAVDERRGTVLTEKTRSVYHHFINRVLIAFFKKKGIKKFEDITPPVIAALQNHLLEKGNKPQTINRYLGVLRTIIGHLIMDGTITYNVFDNVTLLKERAADSKARGCYSIDRIRGVFNRRWEDRTSYILCLMIYSTGLRNSEIEKLKFSDITKIGGYYFFDITKSKTKNGIRIVPLHNFAYQKITSFMKAAGKGPEDYLFSARGGPNQSKIYKKAAKDMADMLNADDEERKSISFYSGRHFWKTLMAAEDLGDVEEYFMGHKVSKDVAKRYNHLDKQGKEHVLEKTREVFGILDRWLFR
jgi:integrase